MAPSYQVKQNGAKLFVINLAKTLSQPTILKRLIF